MKIRVISCLAVLAVLLASCNLPVGSGGATPTASATQATRPRSTATLTIAQPQPASVATKTTLHVEFRLSGGRIVSVTSKDLTPDTGHIHLSIDGRLISMNYQLSQDVSMQPFAAGPHILQGEFVAADHAPFSPRVIAKLIFDYEPAGG